MGPFSELTLAHVLPVFLSAVMGLSLLLYVVLDGHDLGIGILLPFGNADDRDAMLRTVGPFWDANELWLALGSGVLLTAFPYAQQVVLPALELPLAVLLGALVLRGLALMLRALESAPRRAFWGHVFSAGSLLACLAQGWILGSYITGMDKGPWGLLFSAGIALTLPAAFALLGAGWLVLKSDGTLQRKALGWAGLAVWPMAFALVAVSMAAPMVSRAVFVKWFALPQFLLLLPVPLTCAAAFLVVRHISSNPSLVRAGHGWMVYAATMLVFVLAFFGLAYSSYPYIVINQLLMWSAAAQLPELLEVVTAVAVAVPVLTGYRAWVWRAWQRRHPQARSGDVKGPDAPSPQRTRA